MNRLSDIPRVPRPAPQRERLRRWLCEWNLACVLAEDADTVAGIPSAAPPVRDDVAPRPGQVRLLGPRPDLPDRPVYLAILPGSTGGFVSAIPYSRFAEPAVPGELLTERPTPCLRVLCPWNAVAVPEPVLRDSWFCDDLSPQEMAEAHAMLRHCHARDPLPDALIERVGPPLLHPLDPRHRYVEEERALALVLTGERTDADAAPGGQVYPWRDSGLPHEALPRAAEAGVLYGGALYRLHARPLCVRVMPAGEGAGQLLVVEDLDGNRTDTLDGCVVETDAGERTEPIRNGTVRTALPLAPGEFCLVTPSGDSLEVDSAE